MFDLRDHGGHFRGGGSDEFKAITMEDLANIGNTIGEYFYNKTVTLRKILRSNNERDLFIFLSNDEVLKFDSTNNSFGYYCKLSELQSLNSYMYRKYTVHNQYGTTSFMRLNDNIILVRYGNSILVYDTNYNLLTTMTPEWYISTYYTYSWFKSITEDGEPVVIINGFNVTPSMYHGYYQTKGLHLQKRLVPLLVSIFQSKIRIACIMVVQVMWLYLISRRGNM